MMSCSIPVRFRNAGLCVVISAGLFSLVGCQGFMVGKVISEVKGASPQLVVVKDPPGPALLEYQRMKVEPFTSQMGNSLPYNAPNTIRRAVIEQIVRKPMLYDVVSGNADARSTLIVRGTVVHYQTARGLSKAMGGFHQVVCRIQLIDGKTKKIIGEANCGGFSKAMVRSDFGELSDAAAKAFRKWLTHKDMDASEDDEG